MANYTLEGVQIRRREITLFATDQRRLLELCPSDGLTGSYSRLLGLLLDHASRLLVLAQADKLRMS
ncbi:MAG: hypothetical protein DMG35_06765 [Acidobacteria bacterium]|nr:MAG: hypothetical protein DMG35_06765 [Acidobacteriota bacterium]